MRLMMIGTNFRTAPLALREKLALSPDQLTELGRQLATEFAAPQSQVELVWLATCNRAEAYLARPSHRPPSPQQWTHLLARVTGADAAMLEQAQITLTNNDALMHLFRVTSGLDSMVLGEPQILGQVKRSYEQAVDQDTAGHALHRAFQQALATAKRVRHRTDLGLGQASVGSVAIRFARQIFDHFHDKTIVGVGAGAMGKLVLQHAADLTPKALVITNRTTERSEELAQRIRSRRPQGHPRGAEVTVAPWDALGELMVQADMVVFSTGASEPVVDLALLKAAMRKRRGRPLLLMDLAVPRDVAPEIGDLPDVYLYNIDDLGQTAQAAMSQRSSQVQQVEQMLVEPVQSCMWQIQHADLGRVIGQVRKQMHTLAQAEAQRTAAKLSAATGVAVDQIERALGEQAHRLINKILHVPLSQVDHHRADASLAFFAAALRRLFESEGLKGDWDGAASEVEAILGTPSSGSTTPQGQADALEESGDESAKGSGEESGDGSAEGSAKGSEPDPIRSDCPAGVDRQR